MAQNIYHISTYVIDFAREADQFATTYPAYTHFRGRIYSIWRSRVDDDGKVERVIKNYGFLAPLATVGVVAYVNPLLFTAATGVAIWASREARRAKNFSLLKHSIIRNSPDCLTAAVLLIAARIVFLKNSAFYCMTGFATGYALYHNFCEKDEQISPNSSNRGAETSASSKSDQGDLNETSTAQNRRFSERVIPHPTLSEDSISRSGSI